MNKKIVSILLSVAMVASMVTSRGEKQLSSVNKQCQQAAKCVGCTQPNA